LIPSKHKAIKQTSNESLDRFSMSLFSLVNELLLFPILFCTLTLYQPVSGSFANHHKDIDEKKLS
jgi:hypothetical protein